MKRTKINEVLKSETFGSEVNIKGWVRTKRASKNVAFVAMNDGSCLNNCQIVVDLESFNNDLVSKITTGASLSVIGELVQSQGAGQNVEVNAKEIELYGAADPDEYPLQPKKHSLEFLREKAHLRFRTNTFGAITRVRHAMIFATHKFFNDKGYYNIHTPIITGADAEGAGEMFHVTNIMHYVL